MERLADWTTSRLAGIFDLPTCRFVGLSALILLLCFFALDALHALWVWWRARRFERTVTRDANGLLLGAAAYTLEGACPHAPETAILFIHGFNDTPQAWQLLAPRVHELTGATCRVMRLPNTAVELKLQHRARLDFWLDAIRDEVSRLKACHEKVFIAGHSLGGGLALLATRENFSLSPNSALGEKWVGRDLRARRTPGNLPLFARLAARPEVAPYPNAEFGLKMDGLILFSPLIRARRKHTRLFALAERLLWFTRACRTPFPNPIQTKDGRVYGYARDRYVSFAVFRAMFEMARRLAACSESPPYPAPTLVFVSERDRLIDVPAVSRFLPGAKIIATTEAGHALALDTGWEERAAEMAGFVSGGVKK